MRVKICGITVLEDAVFAAEAGADMIGLNFWPKSKRYIAPVDAAALCDGLRQALGETCPLLVGVFVNAVVSDISRTMEIAGLDFAQLAGDESDSMLQELRGVAFKAIRPSTAHQAREDVAYFSPVFPLDERIPSVLIDASVQGHYGGTGHQAAGDVVRIVRDAVPRLMLAGGLTPDNVAERVSDIQPWGVDVASGVEGSTPGRKDRHRVERFIQEARR